MQVELQPFTIEQLTILIKTIMKYKLQFLTILVVLIATSMTANAYDIMVDEICYNFNGDGTSVTVTNRYDGYASARYGISGAVNIPDSITYDDKTYIVTGIAADSFSRSKSITSVTIPNSVITIGNDAFLQCKGLKNVTIGNSVISIGISCFSECESLTGAVLPNSLTYIGSYAFNRCFSLTSVTFPNSISYIGYGLFSYCTKLMSIYSKIENPQNVTLGGGVFVDVNKTSCVLTVPALSLSLYQSAAQWNEFMIIRPDVLVSSVSLNKTQLSLSVGQSEKLVATVLPSNACHTMNWTTSDQSIATVDGNGIVTALAEGTATITAKTTDWTNLTASCVVTVSGHYTPIVRGDVNEDGVVNGADVTTLYRILLGQ